MTRETLEWLAWLIGQQTIALGSPDARDQCARAFAALDEIGAALAREDDLVAQVAGHHTRA